MHYTQRNLQSLGYEVLASTGWDEAKTLLQQPDVQPEIILIEPLLKSNNGSRTLQKICAEAEEIPVIALSTSRDPQVIVEAIQAGVRDYVCKPVEFEQLSETIASTLNSTNHVPGTHTKVEPKEVDLVICGPEMERIYETILQIAETQVPVLIQGESGVGKDLVARMIHREPNLHDKPFVKVNCAAMPSELVESELFGYRKGAFTGAHIDRVGKFEFAHGGTIFLDEIGEFTSSIQAKLLQVLQEGRFTRLGSNQETEVEVRILAATNCKLDEALKDGSFREDLYYRLNVGEPRYSTSSRAERGNCFPLQAFSGKAWPSVRGDVQKLPKELEKLFSSYNWPGNVRELENLVKRYIVLQDDESIREELEGKMTRGVSEEIEEMAESYLQENDGQMDLKVISKKAAAVAEKNMITKTLRRMQWNRWKAAKGAQGQLQDSPD